MFSEARVHPSRTNWNGSLETIDPGYQKLTERTKQLLDLAGMQFPHPSVTCVTIDQTDVGVHTNIAPTITPSGSIWLGHRCRLMTGIEKLALQGIYVPESAAELWGDAFLGDLAGNAFCAANAMIFIIMSMVGISAAENAARSSNFSYAFDPNAESDSEEEANS